MSEMNRKNVIFIVCTLCLTSTCVPAIGFSYSNQQTILIKDHTRGLSDWNPGDDYKMHFPQLPDPYGWDVDATYIQGVFPQNCLADDWKCMESGPITDLHFWGSWLNDTEGDILRFSIAIAADMPADPLTPYSRPGETLWERTFYPDDWVVAGPWDGIQGWYDPGEGFYINEDHALYWQYNIENISNPFIQEVESIYWLSISAIVHPDSPQPRWGWKSSGDHWNDDAVHGYWYELEWIELYEPPAFTTSLDLSFVITGTAAQTNHPPDTPSKPVGPTTVTEGVQYTYTTVTTDIDGDYVRYGFDFNNDGIIEPDHWTDFYPSGTTCVVHVTFYGTGIRYLRAKAQDQHGAFSNFSLPLVINVIGANHAPNTPETPSGPSTGQVGIAYTFSTKTTDLDGDAIKYGWDWDGDGTVDEWSALMSSGSTDTRTHMWSTAGTYAIQVRAEDSKAGLSAFSTPKTIIITSNSAPNKPSISGPAIGRIGRSYSFSATTTDPNGDQLSYWFDWADGTNSGWIGPYDSGQIASMSHIWNTQGSYSIKVKAKDASGAESVWSDPLPVSMPHVHNNDLRRSFHAELGLKDDREAKVELNGNFADMRNEHLLYGTGNLIGLERMFRFQGIMTRNRFIIQTGINSRMLTVIGVFDTYDDTTGTYTGSWRGFIIGYGATNGWIRASYG